MKRILLFPLAVMVFAVGSVSCVTDDWDYDDDYDYDTARWSRRHRYDDYDDAYERGYRDARRYERDRDARGSRPKPPKGFLHAGSFQAGAAVECGIPTSKPIGKVRLVGASGSVSVNSVVLREGSAKTSFAVTRRLAPGETAEVDLGGERRATGLRISTGGKGTFDVYVR